MGYRKIPQETKAAMLAEMQAGRSRSAIARRFGVGPSTVLRMARGAGLPVAGQNDRLRQATGFHSTRTRRRRAQEAVRLLETAARLREQLWLPATIRHFDGRSGAFAEMEISEPEFHDKQAIAISLGIAIDKALLMERVIAAGSDGGKAAIVALVERLREEPA